MKRVYLHGALGERFGRKWSFSASTIPEILWALEANIDGFFEHALSKKQKGVEYVFSSVRPDSIKSKSDIIQEKEFHEKYLKNEIHLIPLTSGATGVEALFALFFTGGKLTALGMFTLSVGIGFAMQALSKPPEPPKRGKPTTTKSFLISGAKNQQSQGVPVPIGYGRLKVGSMNIDVKESTFFLGNKKSNNASILESFTNIEYLDLIAEGPVEGFVNENGGAIHEGDIREGIFLNNVAIKNLKEKKDETDVFNYVLNENEELPQFKKGEKDENICLSNEVSKFKEFGTLLIGAKPYAKNDSAVSAYRHRNLAVEAGAKPFSYTVANKFANKIIINLKVELSQGKDDGNTERNSCRFGIYRKVANKNVNIFDHNSSVRTIKFFDPAVKQDKIIDLQESVDYFNSTELVAATDVELFNSVVEKVKEMEKTVWTGVFISLGGQHELHVLKASLTKDEYDIYVKYKHLNSGKAQSLTQQEVFVENLKGHSSGVFKKESDSRALYVNPENFFFVIEGICSSPYSFDIEIEYNPSDISPDTFSVVKLSSEYDPAVKSDVVHEGGSNFTSNIGGINKQKNLQVYSVQERIPVRMLYPDSAICKIMFDSKNFKSVPERNYHLKLKKILIPSNYNSISRKYDGPWDGLFKGQVIDESLNSIPDRYRFWTDNPAWIFFDLVQNPRYGLGKYGLEEINIDKWQIYKAAKYCDELVETGFSIETSTNSLRTFKTENITNNSAGDDDLGHFTISIYDDSWYIDSNGNEAHFSDYPKYQFEQEFGNEKSFAGKKVAIFIYQHELGQGSKTENQIDLLKKNSALKKGKYIIEERIIKESDSSRKTVTLFGPDFSDNSAVFYENAFSGNAIIGGCCTQISYPIVEPRFTCDAYLNERSDALSIINNLASVFRGLVGYNFGKIFTMQDGKKNPIMVFNQSNVDRAAGFKYSGFEKNKKFTSCLVRFNNKNKNFAPDFVYEEDPDAMRLYGYQQKEIMGFGTTSESQARRMAKWLLYTSQFETEKITFLTGEEGAYLYPSSIVEISDENRAGKSMSGRIIDIKDYKILIDKSIKDIISVGTVEASINVGLPFVRSSELDARAPFHKSSDDQDIEIESYTSPQLYKFSATLAQDIDFSGPQGQNTVLHDLMLKIPFSLDIGANLFKTFNHGLEDGDRIRFQSSGTLPYGLDKERVYQFAYYVISATEHTFKISKSINGPEVVIFDEGRDKLGNEGGIHYACIENITEALKGKNHKAINQVEVGASFSIQGVFNVESIRESGLDETEISSLFISRQYDVGNWYYSSMFGSVAFSPDKMWLRHLEIGWIYVDKMKAARSSDDEFFWFYIQSMGRWVSTNQNLYNKYWFISDANQLEGSVVTAGKWAYIYYVNDENGNPELDSKMYVYENDHGYSDGDEIEIFKNKWTVISSFTSYPNEDNRNGYLIIPSVLKSKIDSSSSIDSAPNAVDSALQQQERESNPSYRSALILNIISVDYLESRQNDTSIRIQLSQGHNLDFYGNNTISISGFDSNSSLLNDRANKTWEIIRISDSEIELIDSAAFARELPAITINNNGMIEYIEDFSITSLRLFQSQLFRVLSVKEVEDRKYEVSGMEYNLSKFDSIDKSKSVTFPSVPIPPQADMQTPEAPENLTLIDLTN
jgi:predicted phage tail protein